MPTPTIYAQQKLRQYNGNAIDLDTATIKVALLTNSYVPNYTTDTTFASISANEVSGSNYTAGGETIAGASVSLSTTNVIFTHNDITWIFHASGFSNARYVVWYDTSSGYLIQGMNLGANYGNATGDFTLDITASGAIVIS